MGEVSLQAGHYCEKLDIGHLHFFSSDRMATAKGNLIPRICYAVHLTILHRRG
jgi:hypothetical protein